MTVLKKILRYVLYIFVALFIAALILPYIFKGKLITFLKEDINKSLLATVDFHDASLSFIKSFPDVMVSIDSLSVIGQDQFDGIVLYKADKTSIDISLSSLFGDNMVPKINDVELIRPEINIVAIDETTANYLISKDTTTSESSPFKLQLDHYSVENGKISYQDNMMDLFMVMQNISHEGSGDFTQDIFDLRTTTHIDSMTVKFEGTKYISNALIDLKADFNMNFPENKYTLRDNKLTFNSLDLTADGFAQLNGDDIVTDFTFKTASEEFKSFLSIIPNAFTADFKDVQTKGKASVQGLIKGVYNGVTGSMPGFDVKINVADGYFKYPTLPQSVSDIFADINIKATRPDYKDMNVNIPNFKMKLGGDPISGKILASNLTGDQNVEGFVKGTLNLKNIIASFPMQGVQELSGILKCDLDFKAKMSDVNNENYTAIKFAGGADASNIVYRSEGMPKVMINKATATASPRSISFDATGMQLGKSDLNLKTDISNPLAMFSTEKSMNINIAGNSQFFDLNEWMAEPSAATQSQEMAPMEVNEDLLKNTNVTMVLSAKKALYDTYTLNNVKLDTKIAANAMDIKNMSGDLDGNDFAISGAVLNAYDYMFNNGTIDGKINLTSNKFDANKFLTEPPAQQSAEPLVVIPVPENVRMSIHTEIKDLTYTNMNLKDFKGDLEVLNQEVALRNVETQTLGGKINMEGIYNTKNINSPDFSVKLDLSKIKFAEAFKQIETFKKIAPIAAYIDGLFNTTLVMKGKLGSQMMPDLNSLDASGFIETLSGSIKGVNPIGKMADKLGIASLKEVNLTNTKNWFEIVKGFFELKPFNKNIGGVDMLISGKHGFGKDMDYNFDLTIPRELMKKNKVGAAADAGLSLLEKEAAKYGVNIDQGPNIFLDVKMTGSFTSPKFSITPKTSKGSSAGNAVQDKVNETVTNIKDSINNELKKKQAELKDTITNRAKEEMEKAKTKAQDAANKTLDSLKNKAKVVVSNKIDSLAKGAVSDSLKQKAKDVINKNAGEEVDKIKDKLKDFNPFKKKGKG